LFKIKLFLNLILAVIILVIQVEGASAAPIAQSSTVIGGTVQRITLKSDPSTGITTVIVEVVGTDKGIQKVRLSEKTASDLGLVLLDGDGKPVINEEALNKYVEITLEAVIPDEEKAQHPVGNALATFFSEVTDYATIMDAHENGVGFGIITQALWMTTKLEGDAEVFKALLLAKETGEYDGIIFDDGTSVKNWGQLRKAVMDGKKMGNLGNVMSNKDNNGNVNGNKQDKDKKDKKDDNGNGGGGGNDKEKKK